MNFTRYIQNVLKGLLVLSLVYFESRAAQDSHRNFKVLERGADWNIISVESSFINGDGNVSVVTNSIYQLETGLNSWSADGQWEPVTNEFILKDGHAVAQGSHHKITIPADISNKEGVVVQFKNKLLRSHVFGLVLYDSASGNSALIGEVRATQGVLVKQNEVVFPDSFDGIKADVKYIHSKQGIEQDILIYENPALPEGFSEETTRLEVWTEFSEFPAAKVSIKSQVKGNWDARQNRLAEDLIDEEIDFEDFKFGEGKSFDVNDRDHVRSIVSKTWTRIGNRTFLIEAVPLNTVQESLLRLPRQKKNQAFRTGRREEIASLLSNFGKDPNQVADKFGKRIAANETVLPFTIDYVLQAAGTLTDVRFRRGVTYLITGPVVLNGQKTIFEGGSVIKFSKESGAKLQVNTNAVFDTSPYQPVVFTASDDNSIGEITPNSGGALEPGKYAEVAIEFNAVAAKASFYAKDLRILYAKTAIKLVGGIGHHVSNLQIGYSKTGIQLDSAEAYLGNALIFATETSLSASGSSLCRAEHVTLDSPTVIAGSIPGSPAPASGWATFVNSLITGTANDPSIPLINTPAQLASGDTFASSQGGTHYLKGSFSYRRTANPALNNPLLNTALEKMTVTAPIMVDGNYQADFVLRPIIPRDAKVEEPGYHYPAIDFVWSNLLLTNSTLVLSNGVAVGIAGSTGLTVTNKGSLISEGTALIPNRIFPAFNVAELPIPGSHRSPVLIRINVADVNNRGKVTAKDTEFYGMGSGTVGILSLVDRLAEVTLKDCLLQGAHLDLLEPSSPFSASSASWLKLINNSFIDSRFNVVKAHYAANTALSGEIFNNTFYNSPVTIRLEQPSFGYPPAWTIQENIFDSESPVLEASPYATLLHSHTGFVNCTAWSEPGMVSLSSFNYEKGPLGALYHSTTSFQNKGTRSLSASQLYHFTTTLNQVREGEGSPTLDIGKHYLASTKPFSSLAGYSGTAGQYGWNYHFAAAATPNVFVPGTFDPLTAGWKAADNLAEIKSGTVTPSLQFSVVRSFTAPRNGTVFVNAFAKLGLTTCPTADGVRIRIGVTRAGPTSGLTVLQNWRDIPTNNIEIPLHFQLNIEKGDKLHFQVSSKGNTQCDETTMVAQIFYLNADYDNDGIADHLEDIIADGSRTGQETYWNVADSDMDGISDLEEIQAKTDPNSAQSKPRKLIASWDFNGNPQHRSNQGHEAVEALNVDFSSIGLDSPSLYMKYEGNLVPRKLKFLEADAIGKSCISPREGTISFWITNQWIDSQDISSGASATDPFYTLFRLESTLGEYWDLDVAKIGGKSLRFQVKRQGDSSPRTPLHTASNLKLFEDRWHHIVLTYSASQIQIYIDGILVSSNLSTDLNNWSSVFQTRYFYVASDSSGVIPNVYVDRLKLYNYPLSETEIAHEYKAVAEKDTDGDGLLDFVEMKDGTDANLWDTDGDGMPDGWEKRYGLNPKSNSDKDSDPDGDLISNWREFKTGRNPLRADALAFSGGITWDPVTSQTSLINIDFGEFNQPELVKGPRRAGFNSEDQWNLISPGMQKVDILSADSIPEDPAPVAGFTMQYGPIIEGANFAGCPVPEVITDPMRVSQEICFFFSQLGMDQNSPWSSYIASIPCCVTDIYEIGSDPFDSFNNWGFTVENGIVHWKPACYLLSLCSKAYLGGMLQSSARPILFTSHWTILRSPEPVPPAEYPSANEQVRWYNFLDLVDPESPDQLISSMDFLLQTLPTESDCGAYFNSKHARGEFQISRLQKGKYRLYYSGSPVSMWTDDPRHQTMISGREHRLTINVNDSISFRYLEKPAKIDWIQLMLLAKLSTPESFSATYDQNEGPGIRLNWLPVPGAKTYEIERAVVSPVASMFKRLAFVYESDQILPDSMMSFVDEDLVPGTVYQYRIRAHTTLPEYPPSLARSLFFPEIEFSSEFTTNINQSVPENYAPLNRAPVLNSIRPLSRAFKNTPFSIGISQLHMRADAYDFRGRPLQFMVTGISEGELKLLNVDPVTQAILSEVEITPEYLESSFSDPENHPPAILSPNTLLQWTPPLDKLGVVPAFRVIAFNGSQYSANEADVFVEVREETILFWWGYYGDGMAGSGAPRINYTGSDNALAYRVGQMWENDPSPVKKHPNQRGGDPLNFKLKNVVSLGVGDVSRGAVLADGSVWTWGMGWWGDLGHQNRHPHRPNDPPWLTIASPYAQKVSGLNNIIQIAEHSGSVVLRADGTVWGWGNNEYGRLGNSELAYQPFTFEYGANEAADSWMQGSLKPVQIQGLENIVKVAASYAGTLALTSDGRVFFVGTWGNWYPDYEMLFGSNIPQQVELPVRCVDIAAGDNHFLVLGTDGVVYSWGINFDNQLGREPYGHFDEIPRPIEYSDPVHSIAAGGVLSGIVTGKGTVRLFGAPFWGTPYHHGLDHDIPHFSNIEKLSIDRGQALAADNEGRIYRWGDSPWIRQNLPAIPTLMDTLTEVEIIGGDSENGYAAGTLKSQIPREVKAVGKNGSVTVSWKRYPHATSYNVFRSLSNDIDTFTFLANVAEVNDREYYRFDDRNVMNGQRYFYAVSAIVESAETERSLIVDATPLPPPSSIGPIAVTSKFLQLQLTWPKSENVESYEVWRKVGSGDFVKHAEVPADTNPSFTYNDLFLEPGVAITYRVYAVNSVGRSAYVESLTAVANPSGSSIVAPTELQLTPLNGGALVKWAPLAPPENGHISYAVWVARADSSHTITGPWQLDQIVYDRVEHHIKDLLNGQHYAVRICAITTEGVGPFSADDFVKPVRPGAPTPIAEPETTVQPGSLHMKWSGEAVSYMISVTPTLPSTHPGYCNSVAQTVYPDEGGSAEFYLGELLPGSYVVNISQITDDYAEATEMADNYTATITEGTSDAFLPIVPLAANNRVELGWYGSLEEANAVMAAYDDWRFILHRRVEGETFCDAWVEIYDGENFRVEDSEVVNGTGYRYRLTGISPSLQVRQVLTSGAVVPARTFSESSALNLAASGANGGAVLSWNKVSSINGSKNDYHLKRSLDQGGPYSLIKVFSDSDPLMQWVDTGLQNGVPHYYIVEAINSYNRDVLPSLEVMAVPNSTGVPPPPTEFEGRIFNENVVLSWQPVDVADYYEIRLGNPLVSPASAPKGLNAKIPWSSMTKVYRYGVRSISRSGQSIEQRVSLQPIQWEASTDSSVARYSVRRRKSGTTEPYVEVARTVAPNFIDVRLEAEMTEYEYLIQPLGNGGEFIGDPFPALPGSYSTPPTVPDHVEKVVMLVGISSVSGSPTEITTPTNFIIQATAALNDTRTRIKHVEFWANGEFLGKDDSLPFQHEWINPPATAAGNSHTISAVMVDSDNRVHTSSAGFLRVRMIPELSAFKASELDLSLGGVGLPLNLTRSYNSQRLQEGMLGKGWLTVWDEARVIVPNLSTGWKSSKNFMVRQRWNLQETTPHQIEVRMPGGGYEFFHPVFSGFQDDGPGITDDLDLEWLLSMNISFAPGASASESQLVEVNEFIRVSVDVSSFEGDNTFEDLILREAISGNNYPYAPGPLIYTVADGTKYSFGDQLADVMYLQSIEDRAGNKITFESELVSEGGSEKRVLSKIKHSNGRVITLTRPSTSSPYWKVFDHVAGNPVNDRPVLKYKVSGPLLTEVHRLKKRSEEDYWITKYEYDTSSRLTKVINHEGVIVLENSYDSQGFLLTQRDGTGSERSYSYTDVSGGVKTGITQNQTSQEVVFDSYGQVASVKDETGVKTELSYDGRGRVITEKIEGAESYKSFDYDSLDRVVSSFDELGNAQSLSYADFGQVKMSTDAAGQTTQYEYWTFDDPGVNTQGNPAGSLKSITEPGGLMRQFTYNVRGQVLTEQTFAAGLNNPLTIVHQYDAKGDLTSTRHELYNPEFPDLYVSIFSYDNNGNRLSEKQSRTVPTRDASGIVTGSAVQHLITTYEYDPANRVIKTIDPLLRSTAVIYDSSGRVTETIDAFGRSNRSLYGVRGELLEKSFPDGTVQRTVYDANGRAVWQQDRTAVSGNNSVGPATQTVYDAAGRVVQVIRAENVTLAKVTLAPATSYVNLNPDTHFYAASSAGPQYKMLKIAGTTPAIPVSTNQTIYDSIGRVKFSIDALGRVSGYGYDAAGRRTSVTQYSGFTATYPIANPATFAP
ncbi:MAG: LamG-like jellyroll fold domain-containing protein, partial [Verrucomicrobiota bacterium]|nr:LamG-like jellyroll fold domain-containing protein [Verrucomicrobiota bacterium]